MTANPKVYHGVPAESLIRLKTEKLGRHHHKIPQQIQESARKYPHLFPDYFRRGYRVNFELKHVEIDADGTQPAEVVFECPLGRAGFAIDRSLLAEVVEFHYGGKGQPGVESTTTLSERRLCKRLGRDVIDIFAQALLGGESFGTLTELDNDFQDPIWEYVARFDFLSHTTGHTGSVHIHLDTDLVDELIRRLTKQASSRQWGDIQECVKQLPVRLDCVIAAAQMPLAQVLSLAPGDVVTLRPFDRYEVRINQQECFKGTICEAEGALYITSLEVVKSA